MHTRFWVRWLTRLLILVMSGTILLPHRGQGATAQGRPLWLHEAHLDVPNFRVKNQQMAMSGTTIVLATPILDNGVVTIFERDHGGPRAWGQRQRLTPPGPNVQMFGSRIALLDDLLLITGQNPDMGVYLFTRNPDDGEWRYQDTLSDPTPDPLQYFGHSIAISGSWLAIGETAWSSSGKVHLFRRSPTSLQGWRYTTSVSAPTHKPDFGASVALHSSPDGFDTMLLVGAPCYGDSQACPASAYVFRPFLGSDAWSHVGTLTARDGSPYDNFGATVAIAGASLVVGAPDGHADATPDGRHAGVVYVFRRALWGPGWVQTQRLTPSRLRPSGGFGTGLTASATRIVIGYPGDQSNQGSVAIYAPAADAPSIWAVDKQLSPGPNAPPDWDFGSGISMEGDHVLVGSYGAADLYYTTLVTPQPTIPALTPPPLPTIPRPTLRPALPPPVLTPTAEAPATLRDR